MTTFGGLLVRTLLLLLVTVLTIVAYHLHGGGDAWRVFLGGVLVCAGCEVLLALEGE